MKITEGPPGEIGKELKLSELVPETIYVLSKEGHRCATLWFIGRWGDHYAQFLAGILGVTLILRVGPDDLLTDDTGARIFVHEYLGQKDG